MIPNFVKKVGISLGLTKIFSYPFANEHSQFLINVVDSSFKQRKTSKSKRNDLLDMMIAAVEGSLESSDGDDIHSSNQYEKDAKLVGHIKGKNLSYDHVAATALFFLIAGYETTARTLGRILYDLAMNQDCQETLYEELTQSGKAVNKLSYESLQMLPYLDAVIHESLRRHPPFAFNERVCTKDYAVRNSNIVIRKGDLVRVSVAGILLDPEIYPNPLEYNPERFLKENTGNINPYAFLVFSVGPRNCIGMRFSMFEVKCAIRS